jgi:hypothetical protein
MVSFKIFAAVTTWNPLRSEDKVNITPSTELYNSLVSDKVEKKRTPAAKPSRPFGTWEIVNRHLNAIFYWFRVIVFYLISAWDAISPLNE